MLSNTFKGGPSNFGTKISQKYKKKKKNLPYTPKAFGFSFIKPQ